MGTLQEKLNLQWNKLRAIWGTFKCSTACCGSAEQRTCSEQALSGATPCITEAEKLYVIGLISYMSVGKQTYRVRLAFCSSIRERIEGHTTGQWNRLELISLKL